MPTATHPKSCLDAWSPAPDTVNAQRLHFANLRYVRQGVEQTYWRRPEDKSPHFPIKYPSAGTSSGVKMLRCGGEAQAVSAPDVSPKAARGKKKRQQRETQNPLNPGTSATPCPPFSCQTRLGM